VKEVSQTGVTTFGNYDLLTKQIMLL